MEIIAKGAEAIMYRDGDFLVKKRVKKEYRVGSLDKSLRKQRTRREVRYLQTARDAGLSVPKVFEVDEKNYVIKMEFLEGRKLKDVFDSCSDDVSNSLAVGIGVFLKKLHGIDLIHNDLTTSNMILVGGDVFFIDFGLALHSKRVEDKAMDIVVFKKSLRATHPLCWERLWEKVVEGYSLDSSLLKRVETIEKRVRYS